jgi:triosephosphate isomerase
MRKQIAAANWKMNLNYQEAETLLDEILDADIETAIHQLVIFAVPYPYLIMCRSEVEDEPNFEVAAQNCHHKKSGAFTGEVSVDMLHSIGVNYCIIGHSERREYNAESNALLAEKVSRCLERNITPIFCCGEPLSIREANTQNEFVAAQLRESLFHLQPNEIKDIIIAYEPIWAIGTGRTATTEQAQEIHHYLRSVIAGKYGDEIAGSVSILYGGSVKATNAEELFACPDVDGGLVGGASLVAADFISIINALK